jgi:valyl-tRNA synthetase
MPQWFIRMQPLASRAREAIERGEVVFIPDHYRKIVLHWLENIADWNISRQIVWGIPIPAKICEKCEAGVVDLEDAFETCEECGGALREDSDTFDTWFSSGQWPFAALGYPDSNDFKTFFPTDVLETAGEIIFFWVARMIMLSLYVTGSVPFRTVYLHGLVLDARGRKMSKSVGNVIDPLTLTERYGTDAVRMGLIVGNTPGTSLALAEERIRGYKHFANKLWNVARFVVGSSGEKVESRKWNVGQSLRDEDKKRLDELDELTRNVTDDLEHYRLYLAAEKLYHYVWHTFADKIIEEMKPRLRGEDSEDAHAAAALLDHILRTSLALLHPFMPFVTEAIWSIVERREREREFLMVEPWPFEH